MTSFEKRSCCHIINSGIKVCYHPIEIPHTNISNVHSWFLKEIVQAKTWKGISEFWGLCLLSALFSCYQYTGKGNNFLQLLFLQMQTHTHFKIFISPCILYYLPSVLFYSVKAHCMTIRGVVNKAFHKVKD